MDRQMNKRFGRDDLIAAHYTLSGAARAERGRRGLARERAGAVAQ